MQINEIYDGEILLAKHIPESVAWADGLSFFSNDEDFEQVGTWGYDKGKHLLAHIHNKVERTIAWTQEVLYVRSGAIKAKIYDTNRCFKVDLTVSSGDILVLLRGGHGYEVLEDGTKVLEIKNGPYLGAEADRSRF